MTHVPDARRSDEDPLEVEGTSDAELISAVRGGDLEAYGHLFERHVEAARRLARQLVPGLDADDLVSDAFAKVLAVLQNGGGPDLAFRAYLLTAIRRLHVDRIRSGSKLQTTDDMSPYDPGVPFHDTAVAGFENATAAKAFASLPERWQQVLWHTEVEGQKPADVAPLLGMSANSVSALAYRAREGLREAFVSMHAAEAIEDACAVTRSNLGAYIRGGSSRRDAAKIEGHLQGCRECTAIYLELTEVNSNLGAVLAPLLLGTAGAGYLAAAHLGAAAAAKGGVVLAFGRAKDWVLHHPLGRTTGGAGVAAAAVIAVALGLHATSGPSTTPDSALTAPAPTTPPVTAPQTPPSSTTAPPSSAPTLPAVVRPPVTPAAVVTPTSPSTTPATPAAPTAAVTVTPLAAVQVPSGSASVSIDLGAGVEHPAGTTLVVRSAKITGSTPHGQVRIGSTATRVSARIALRTSTSTITYTPDPSWRGTETIAYVLGDGQGSRASGTVKVTTPNRAPVAVDDHIELHAVYATAAAVTLNLLGNDSDANGDTLRIVGVSAATGGGGSVALVGGQVRYTRPVWSVGQVSDRTDTFTYTVSDGHGGTATARVTVVVGLNPNTAPVASDQQVSTHWSTPVTLTPQASDPDGDALSLSVTDGAHGTATLSNGVITYTPSSAYVGTDTFHYTAGDGHTSTTATVTVTLTNAHPAGGDSTPIAITDTGTASITVPATDADGDPLTISDVSGATQTGRTLTWDAPFGVNSTHTIGYTVSDGVSSAQVTVPVTATRPSATVSIDSTHPASTDSVEKHHFKIVGLPSDHSVRVRIELTGGGTPAQNSSEGGASCTTLATSPTFIVECTVTSGSDFYHLDFNPVGTWSLDVTATPLDFDGPVVSFHRPS
ncbi:sigma-70 family RNA polymerase sigma factor [Nocardioides sp.]|uniref:sigma-70 family RNA polymerase sigma factor n=1 Tax=Nocardioides sp. TaxID=35761 RepID=UPI0026046EF7|nr:sigma-70 family RNA polymerase sigma factor [Nocardioides sp.]